MINSIFVIIYEIITYGRRDIMISELLERDEIKMLCAKSVTLACNCNLHRGNKDNGL